MTEEKKIVFAAEGSGLSNVISKARADFKGLDKEVKNISKTFADQAKSEGLVGKEALRYTQDMLKLLKEQLNIQKELTKERISGNKAILTELGDAHNYQANKVRKEAELDQQEAERRLDEIKEQERVVAKAASINRFDQRTIEPEKKSIFNAVVAADVLRDVFSVIRQGAQAQTGVELVKPVLELGGAAAGGLVSLIPGLGEFGGTLSKIFKEGAGLAGDLYVRHRYAQEEFNISKNRYLALTRDTRGASAFDSKDNLALDRFNELRGITKRKEEEQEQLKKDTRSTNVTPFIAQQQSRLRVIDGRYVYSPDSPISIPDENRKTVNASTITQQKADELNLILEQARIFETRKKRFSNLGATQAQAFEEMTRVAGISGTSRDSENKAAMSLALDAGFGVSKETTAQALGIERMGGGSGITNIQKVMGMAMTEGIERTRMPDAIKEQTSIFKQLLSSSDNVSVDTVNNVMFKMNRLGGQFSIGNPMAEGLISSVQEGLTNPSDAYQAAQSNKVLSKLFPGIDPWEMFKKQKAGLGTEGLLEGRLEANAASSRGIFRHFANLAAFGGGVIQKT